MRRNVFQIIGMWVVACSLLLQGAAGAAMAGCHESSSDSSAPMHQMHEHDDATGEHANDPHLKHSHAGAKADKAQKDKAGDCCDCHAACKASFMLPFLDSPSVKISSVVTTTPILAHQSSDLIPPYRPPISA